MRRIMTGTYVLSAGYYDAYYLKAQRVRQLIAADFARTGLLDHSQALVISAFRSFGHLLTVADQLAAKTAEWEAAATRLAELETAAG